MLYGGYIFLWIRIKILIMSRFFPLAVVPLSHRPHFSRPNEEGVKHKLMVRIGHRMEEEVKSENIYHDH